MPEDQPSSGQATDSLAAAEWLQLNRANWDERTPIHVGSRFYRVDEFKSGVQTLHGFELDELPDLAGKDLVHLQCHFGLDTLSLARKGARVTGLDFSGPAVEAARELASAMGIDARFIEANVYDARAALGQAYDVVYTGKGAINWLPDIVTWAEIIADLLRPGGVFYLSEFHPVHSMLADDGANGRVPLLQRGPHGLGQRGGLHRSRGPAGERADHRVGSPVVGGGHGRHRGWAAARLPARVRGVLVQAVPVAGRSAAESLDDTPGNAGRPDDVLAPGGEGDVTTRAWTLCLTESAPCPRQPSTAMAGLLPPATTQWKLGGALTIDDVAGNRGRSPRQVRRRRPRAGPGLA